MKLHVERLGQGFPLIILHGLYGSGDNWLTIARNLAGFCEVYLPDLRNHGRSPHSDQHSYQDLADDLLELMDDSGIPKAVLVGHSMGGKTAMWFAAQHPERVSQLIVADISPRNYLDGEDEKNHSGFHQRVMHAMAAVDFTIVTSLGAIDQQLTEALPDKALRQFLLKNIVKGADGLYAWRLNINGLLKNLANLSLGLEPFLEAGSVFTSYPVLFIRGENSAYIGEPDRLMIGKLYPDAKVVSIAGAGHWLHAEQPAAVIAAIRKQLVASL
jgi:pimeloyl-ACP methyl ester carboxylesterase